MAKEKIKQLMQTGHRRWLVIFPLIGLVVLIALVKMKSPPTLKQGVDFAPLVEVEQAAIKSIAPTISGYGRAQAKESWQAVSEVSGRVIYRHEKLEKGAMIPKDTVVLKIDPVDYQLKLAQAKSDLNSAKAEADRIALNESKMRTSLELEQNRLGILQKELKRKQGLAKQGSISRSLLDQEQSNVYAQQQKVLDLQTSIKLIPNDIEVAKARVQVNESRVKEAERKLAKTTITMPFDARISAVNAELEQVINQQGILISANHLGAMEITAQFSVDDLRKIVHHSVPDNFITSGEFPDIRDLRLKAVVSSPNGSDLQRWEGEVTRIGDSIDAQGNTVALVVELENDWVNFDPINKPPLMNDMFLQVNVTAGARELLTVPAKAVHGGEVYVAIDNKLVKKPVGVMFEKDGLVAVNRKLKDTITAGEHVIVTDLLPAIDQMTIKVASLEAGKNAQSLTGKKAE